MTLGPGTDGYFESLPLSVSGAATLGQFDAVPTAANGAGTEGAVNYIPTTSTGPIFDHVALAAPDGVTGPVSDNAVGALTTGNGPVFDHDVLSVPVTNSGPVVDSFTGFPNTSKSGPVFHHRVTANIPPDWAHGAVYDKFVTKTLSNAVGPVFDALVSSIPALLDVGNPDTVIPTPIRNRLSSLTLEILSPGIYGLEKDPTTGKLTGFKY